MTKLTIEDNYEETPVIHKVGNFYIKDGEVFILAGVDEGCISLISLVTGFQYKRAWAVENSFLDIPESYLDSYVGGFSKFKYIPSLTLSFKE